MFGNNPLSPNNRGLLPSKQKKPGPRPNKCIWCNEVQCTHCQCPGYPKCDHRPGEPCMRNRYKRRLVCNPCEKNKLKEEPIKKTITRSISKDRVNKRKNEKIIGTSRSVDNVLHSSNHWSFEVLLRAADEMRKADSLMAFQSASSDQTVSSSQLDDVGLCMDSSGVSSPNEDNTMAEEVSVVSNQTTPGPSYYPSNPYSFQPYAAYMYSNSLPSPTRQPPHLSTSFFPKPLEEIIPQRDNVPTQSFAPSPIVNQSNSDYPFFQFRGM